MTKFKMDSEAFRENGLIWKYANLVIILFANILYFKLTISEVFGYDEAYTVGMIYRDFSDIIQITSNDVHAPFYYCLLKLFYHTVGMEQLVSVKIFSWLFLFIYLIFGGRLCRKHFSRKVEFFWLILSGFMPAMMIQVTSARMYTFGLFWVTCSCYLAYSLYQEEKSSKWILFTLSTIICIYIHTFCMIEMVIVYIMFIIAALIKKRYKTLRNILIAGTIVSCSYFPWLLVLWKQFSRWAGWESGWSNTIQEFGLPLFKLFLAEWFSAMENPQPWAVWFGVGLLFFAGFYTIKYVIKTKDVLPCLGLIVALVVLGIAIAVSVLIVPCFLGRYLFPLFGGIWLFVAVGMSQIKWKWLQGVLVIGVIFCGIFHYNEEVQLEDETGLNQYKEFIENELGENDIIMADTYFLMMMSIYEPEANYMIYGYKADGLPFDNCEAFKVWQQLDDVETVWYLSMNDFRAGNLNEKYTCIDKKVISFSCYNIVIEKCVKNTVTSE